MSQASLLIPPKPQFFDNNGVPLVGGKVYFYSPGTSTPKTIYSGSDALTALSNPVILDSAGRASIWLSGYYDMVLEDSLGNQIYSEPNVSSQYNVSTQFSQWLLQADVLTYISGTEFSVPGDRTDDYQTGRRIKATVAAGTRYGTIDTAVYSTDTTITVIWDSGSLDAGLSTIWLGIITTINSSYPVATFEPPVGTIMDWLKSYSGTPTLPGAWVECNGQTLSDPLSPYNGQVIPNINGDASGADTFSNSKTAVFVRGATTSGSYVADKNKSHTHALTAAGMATHTHSGTSLTAASHLHDISHTTGIESADHTHSCTFRDGTSNVGSGSAVANVWQFLLAVNTGGVSANHTHSFSGNSGNSGPLAISGSTGNNSASGLTGSTNASTAGSPDETTPKYMTAVKIMRVH